MYSRDLVLSDSPLWVDSRAFNNVDEAITSIGSDNRTLYINRPENISKAIPSNISLSFGPEGRLVSNVGQVIVSSPLITASEHQLIFDTASSGSWSVQGVATLHSSWFGSLESALIQSSGLKKEIQVGIDDTLASDLSAYDLSDLTIVIKPGVTVTHTVSQTTNFCYDPQKGGLISVAAGVTLTIGSFNGAGKLYQMFTGDGGVIGNLEYAVPQWFGAKGDSTNDDYPAFTKAVGLSNKIKIPKGNYKLSQAINTGTKKVIFIGECSGRFGGGVFGEERSTIFNDNPGDGCIWQCPPKSLGSYGQIEAIEVYNLNLSADYPIKINYEDGLVLDGANSDIPYPMRPIINNCAIEARTTGEGIGISLTKCFDFSIELNEISYFDIDILMQGCDIGRVKTNRLLGAGRYGILDISIGTFGSQSIIANNDILGTYSRAVIKTTNRHPRIDNNYLETLNMYYHIDCTSSPINGEAIPQFGTQSTNDCAHSAHIETNRIDTKDEAINSVYRLSGCDRGITLIDEGNTGVVPANEIEIVNNYFNTCYNSSYSTFMDIMLGDSIVLKTTDKPILISNGFIINYSNLARICVLGDNSAYQALKISKEGDVVWLADQTDPIPYLMFPEDLLPLNSFFKVTLLVSSDGSDQLTCGTRYDTTNHESCSTIPSSEPTEVSFILSTTDTKRPTGIYLIKTGTTGNFYIKYIKVEKVESVVLAKGNLLGLASGSTQTIYTSKDYTNAQGGVGYAIFKVRVEGYNSPDYEYSTAIAKRTFTLSNYGGTRRIALDIETLNESVSVNSNVINLALSTSVAIVDNHFEVKTTPTLTGSNTDQNADVRYVVERVVGSDIVY